MSRSTRQHPLMRRSDRYGLSIKSPDQLRDGCLDEMMALAVSDMTIRDLESQHVHHDDDADLGGEG